jgi:hypothetical protein
MCTKMARLVLQGTLQEYFKDIDLFAWRPLRFSGHTRARQKQERAPLFHLRAIPLLVLDVSLGEARSAKLQLVIINSRIALGN